VRTLTLRVLERGVRVVCADSRTQSLVTAAYGGMRGDAGEGDLEYTVGRDGVPATFFIKRRDGDLLSAPDDGAFLAQFDEDFAIEVQKLRHDLYFVHAAVVKCAGGAVMLIAKPGGGKSTLCWALLHHGFRYLSDELGPVNLETLEVHPYVRALALKQEPPASYPLPPLTVRTSRSFHVPAEDSPSRASDGPAPLSAVFFLCYGPATPTPSVRRMSSAEAAVRLYANALNPLAHEADGLDGAIHIATASPCFELITADLRSTCALLTATLERPF
jgi:hypothetical protein